MRTGEKEVAEAALAHNVGSRIDATYRSSDLFERRRRLMDDGAGYLASPSREPQTGAALDGLPARDHCGGSDPKNGGEMVNYGMHHLPLPGGAPAPKNMGSLPPLALPPGAAHGRRGDTPGAALPRLSQPTRGIRANPCPMRVSAQSLDHNGEGFAL